MKYLNFFWGLLLVLPLRGQHIDSRIAPTQAPLSKVEILKMRQLDNQALLETEQKRRQPGRAPRFAEVLAVNVKPSTHGDWEYLKDGRAVWRLRIQSPGAYSLNLGFTLYQMPAGGRLILYSADRQRVIGPFTPADNETHAQLWTPVLEGDDLVMEVQLPKEKIPELGLHLSTVNHDFMGFAQVASGSCNLDVICGQSDGYDFVEAYRDVIQSVAVYGVRGNLFCTGFLVNNTRRDCTPFFMTAAHCEVSESEAPSLVVYWNYQNSTCRELGSAENSRPGDGRLNDFNTGAILRASYNPSDMALLELDDPVSPTAEAYFAGWTREETPPQNGVASIHHPNADEKSISYAARPTYLGAWATGAENIPNGDHIVVPEWAIGTTETGSSGGPLFNERAEIVGQLHGGVADCISGGYDTYGRFATSWEGGGTPSTSLRRWLDPDNTGVLSLGGRSQRSCSFFVEAAIPAQSVCAPDEAVYTLAVSEVFSSPVNLQVTGLPEGLSATFSVNPVTPGETTELRVQGSGSVESGNYTFTVIGAGGTESAAASLELQVYRQPPSAVNLLEPANGADELGIRANFSWAGQPFTTRYAFELATDPAFENIVASVSDLAGQELNNFALAALTTYYWRVRGRNLCGWGPWSPARSFTTAGLGCTSTPSLHVPIAISTQVNTITSTIYIAAPGQIQEMRLTGLDISHSFVGDLRVSLISPQGTSVVLFDRPGLPRTFFGCDGNDLRLDFSDDAASSPSDLENTCNEQPAIEGLFRPLQAFANLKGESITGTWTLQVEDLVPEDGGRLNGWALDFCTTLPQTAALFTATDRYQACSGDPIVLDLLLGSGFPAPVTLTTEGLPPEATVTFSSNPAAPGASLNVYIEGLSGDDVYDLVFRADTASAAVQILLIDLPEAAAPIAPADSSLVHSAEVTLTWRNSPGADYYELIVYEDVIAGPPFLSVSTTDTVFTLTDLDFDADYFWQVTPQAVCSGKEPTDYQVFFTLPDLALGVTPVQLNLCQNATGSLQLTIGPGFVYPARISSRIAPPDTLGLSYSVAPDQITPGATIDIALEDLSRISPGSYTLTFLVQDSLYADSIVVPLEVAGSPGLASLMEPANNTTIMDPLPTFSWGEAPLATAYRLEIATDQAFSDVVQRREVNLLSLRLMEALVPGAYYWRVTALNRCGGATSAARRFSVESSGTTDWAGAALYWYPNPAREKVFLQFDRPPTQQINYQLLTATGALIHTGALAPQNQEMAIDLHDLPAGLYFIRLWRPGATAVLRIMKQ